MAKPIIITNLGFKKPGQIKPLRHLLKYLQHRDGSVRREAFLETGQYPDGLSDAGQSARREAKWVNRGMGETYRQILKRAIDWQGRRTLARTWVISPDPELMLHVPEDRRFEVMKNVTEKTVERWYGDNGWGQAEYSYVLHDKHRSKDGMQMLHAHVVTPATIPVDAAGELGRIDHIVHKPHILDLRHTAAESFEQELGRVLGKEQARQLIAERDARLERERWAKRPPAERLHGLRALADINQLIRAERTARSAKKKNQRRRRLERMAELRMYARYVNEEREKRREADVLRIKAARERTQAHELTQERERQRQHREQIQERGKHIPTHAEIVEQEEEQRSLLHQYYIGLFIDQGLLEQTRDSEVTKREIER
jgi:hypothetical protein